MMVQQVMEMRRKALEELGEYRRHCLKLRKEKVGDRQRVKSWVTCIARVREALGETDPEKERFMNELFGLDHVIPKRQTARERLLRLSWDMNCAEATLYNWRAEIVELVLYAAIEAGLLHPFQSAKGGRTQKKKL